MSTLAEIQAALETLPRTDQELLHAHLAARLETSSASSHARLAALDALQTRLGLDASKGRAWQVAAREARR